MEILIDHGALINIASNSGDTVLHFACANGQQAGVSLLLSKAAVYKANKKNQLPVEIAVERRHEGIIKILIERLPNMITSLTQLSIKDGVDESNVRI